MPHPTTLMKTTKRCGEATIADLNDALLAKAVAARVVKCDKLRADTTVVEGNVAYPTDSGLLAKGVAKMAAMVKALQGMGLATRTRFRDRSRSMRRRAHAIGAWLRRRTEDAKDEVKAINAETATIAEATLEEARRVAANAARSLRQAGSDASGKSQALPPGRPERLPPRSLPGPFVVADPLEGVGHLGHTVEAGFGRPRLRRRLAAHAGRPLRLGQEDGLDRTEPNGVPRLVFSGRGGPRPRPGPGGRRRPSRRAQARLRSTACTRRICRDQPRASSPPSLHKGWPARKRAERTGEWLHLDGVRERFGAAAAGAVRLGDDGGLTMLFLSD